jgi:Tfp pilus assembly protein PilV
LARRRGFSIIEALIASVLVGLGIASLMVATKSGTQVNAASRDIARATRLGQEIREWTIKMSFDEIEALGNVTYSPPRDGMGQTIADMTGWSQQITLTRRDPDDLCSPGDADSDVIHVEVTVLYDNRPVLVTGWFVTRRV